MSRKETIITREELGRLPEYSCSIPTGTTMWKRWRRNINAYREDRRGLPAEWLLCEYVDVGSTTEVGIQMTWPVTAPGEPIRGDL